MALVGFCGPSVTLSLGAIVLVRAGRDASGTKPRPLSQRWKRATSERQSLLQALPGGIVVYEGIENRQNMSPVLNHPLKHRPQFRLASSLFIPFRQHRSRDSNVLPQLLRGMAAQKEPIKESSLALRKFEVAKRLIRCGWQRVWLSRHIEKNAVYGFLRLRQEYARQNR